MSDCSRRTCYLVSFERITHLRFPPTAGPLPGPSSVSLLSAFVDLLPHSVLHSFRLSSAQCYLVLLAVCCLSVSAMAPLSSPSSCVSCACLPEKIQEVEGRMSTLSWIQEAKKLLDTIIIAPPHPDTNYSLEPATTTPNTTAAVTTHCPAGRPGPLHLSSSTDSRSVPAPGKRGLHPGSSHSKPPGEQT